MELGREEQDWSRLVTSLLIPLSVLAGPSEVSELDPVEDLEGMDEVGEESREYCKSDIEFGRGRSRLDFCRMNLESL